MSCRKTSKADTNKADENLAWEEISTEHIVQDRWIDFRKSVYLQAHFNSHVPIDHQFNIIDMKIRLIMSDLIVSTIQI